MHMRIIITGHTGFKGSWMSALLATLGHEVHGLSHEIVNESHYKFAELSRFLASDSKIDVRDPLSVGKHFLSIKPDFVVHLAAQAFVREGFRKPFETFDTNFRGTINVIKACKEAEISNLLVITSDKVYRESATSHSFCENDPLGGKDPYSASKAAADLATQSFATQADFIQISIARAGNVIGGGDFGQERLIPDLFRAQVNNTPAIIRNPNAIRPWQHVLDCLDGYISIMNNMYSRRISDVWNIGPREEDSITVMNICEKASSYFRNPTIFNVSKKSELTMKESQSLRLDSTKISHDFGWMPKFNTDSAIEWTFNWYEGLLKGNSVSKLTENQINRYLKM